MERLIERHGVTVADVFAGPDTLRQKLAAHGLPQDLQSAFDAAKQSLQANLDAVKEKLARLDRTLVDAAETAASKMRYQLERLHERAARAQLRRSEDQARHADELINALYPNKNLQEREIAGISYLARYGTQLLLRLYDAAQTSCPDHQVVSL